MDGFKKVARKLCSAELDRVTAAEICLDELLTIMDRHNVSTDDAGYSLMREFSARLHGILTTVDGAQSRRKRLIRIRSKLTEAFPLSDADLVADHQ